MSVKLWVVNEVVIRNPSSPTIVLWEAELRFPPTGVEVFWRLIYWGLPAVAVTLILIRLTRRLVRQNVGDTPVNHCTIIPVD